MSDSWTNSVNQVSGVNIINNINNYVDTITLIESPIDLFYKNTREIIQVGNPTFLNSHPSIGPLLLVGIVSATENYFRDIFSRVISICPTSKACASSQSINLGSVVWHGGVNVERGAFEHISLAGSDSIIKTCKNFTKFDIKKGMALYSVLEEYDKVCELRHGIVHSNSILAGKNAIKLGINSTSNLIKINIGYNQLQDCASVCTTLVATFNSELFNEIAKRWAIDWRRIIAIDASNEHILFKQVWESFYSNIDATNNLIPNKLSMIKCKNKIKRVFGVD